MKALIAARDDKILGFVMIGAEAGEVAPSTDGYAGRPAIHRAARRRLAHPTIAEALGPLFSNVPPRLS